MFRSKDIAKQFQVSKSTVIRYGKKIGIVYQAHVTHWYTEEECVAIAKAIYLKWVGKELIELESIDIFVKDISEVRNARKRNDQGNKQTAVACQKSIEECRELEQVCSDALDRPVIRTLQRVRMDEQQSSIAPTASEQAVGSNDIRVSHRQGRTYIENLKTGECTISTGSIMDQVLAAEAEFPELPEGPDWNALGQIAVRRFHEVNTIANKWRRPLHYMPQSNREMRQASWAFDHDQMADEHWTPLEAQFANCIRDIIDEAPALAHLGHINLLMDDDPRCDDMVSLEVAVSRLYLHFGVSKDFITQLLSHLGIDITDDPTMAVSDGYGAICLADTAKYVEEVLVA